MAEPLASVVAFAGWALGSPGTPLAAMLNASAVGIVTTTVAGLAVLTPAALGKSVLTKSATGVREVAA